MIIGPRTMLQNIVQKSACTLCLFPLIYSMLKPEIGAPGPPGPSPGPPRPPPGGPPGPPPDPGNLLLGSVKMTPFGGVPPKWAKMAILGHFGGSPGGPKKGPKRAIFGVENRPRNWPQKGPIFDLILAQNEPPILVLALAGRGAAPVVSVGRGFRARPVPGGLQNESCGLIGRWGAPGSEPALW